MIGHSEVDSADRYDVVVVGAGAAGFSAALVLGRARRSVLVVDDGRPRNAPAAHMHGFLSRDGVPPGELLEVARREVTAYGVEVRAGRAVSVVRDGDGDGDGDGFTVGLEAGSAVRVRRLLAASGVADGLPEVPGLAARWGRDVVHCPYCHGWEIRDQPIGVLATGPMAVHQALLFRQWSDRVSLLVHTADRPTAQQGRELAARGIAVVDGVVSGLEVTGDRLSGVRLDCGDVLPLHALAVAPRPVPRVDFLSGVGLEASAHPSGFGTHVAADPTGATAVSGVWVAGNLADPFANVISSAASGSTAAAAINADLVAEDTREAVRACAEPFSAESEARVSEHVLGGRRHGV